MDKMINSTDTRRELFRLYNTVNKEIYGYGVTELKITCMDGMIVFLTKDNRVHTLKVLEKNNFQLKQAVDQALFMEFKKLLGEELEKGLNIRPAGILRDYDTKIQTAVTVVLLPA